MRDRLRALSFFAAWFVAGSFIAGATIWEFAIASIGGVSDPPVIWTLANGHGSSLLALLLPFGGIPASIEIWRGRKWKKVAAITFGACVIVWSALVFVVFIAPQLLGWTW